MNYACILNELSHISEAGTAVSQNGYNPAWNVAVMMYRIQQLMITIQDEANKEQESK